jgi:hypothetical protein
MERPSRLQPNKKGPMKPKLQNDACELRNVLVSAGELAFGCVSAV